MVPKFRAWDKLENRMWDVANIRFEKGLLYCVEVVDDKEMKYKNLYPADFILLQSTGLTDKNGTEGFKDDLIRSQNGRLWQIKHDHYVWKKPFDEDELYGFYFQSVDNHENCCFPIYDNFGEIVGNKWENPEFLEQNDGS